MVGSVMSTNIRAHADITVTVTLYPFGFSAGIRICTSYYMYYKVDLEGENNKKFEIKARAALTHKSTH